MTSPIKCAGCKDGEALGFDFVMAYQPIIENRYRFDQACRVKAITGAGELFNEPHLRLSINFMPNAVYEPPACIRTSLATAERVGFARDRILFEFTEEERLDVKHIQRIIAEYKRLGFMVALDDFGSGYNGLSLLADMQPDMIKLDMSILRDTSPVQQTIVNDVVGIARALNIQVLGEGVESEEELKVLMAAGITLFQGYLFAKPAIGTLPTVPMLGNAAPARFSA